MVEPGRLELPTFALRTRRSSGSLGISLVNIRLTGHKLTTFGQSTANFAMSPPSSPPRSSHRFAGVPPASSHTGGVLIAELIVSGWCSTPYGNHSLHGYQRGDMLDWRRKLMEAWAKFYTSDEAPASGVVSIRKAG